MQAAGQKGLQHERLQRLLDHLDASVPPCMSEANDWEAIDDWLDELVPTYEAMPLPGIPDPSMPAWSNPRGGVQKYSMHVVGLLALLEAASKQDAVRLQLQHQACDLLEPCPVFALMMCQISAKRSVGGVLHHMVGPMAV